jgi:hypothetical protein
LKLPYVLEVVELASGSELMTETGSGIEAADGVAVLSGALVGALVGRGEALMESELAAT